MTFSLMDLPYDADALEPVLSAETLRLHHGKHHRGYVDKLNRLIRDRGLDVESLEELIRRSEDGVFQNAAQVWNHDCYWQSMAPGGTAMPRDLQSAVEDAFGDGETLRRRFLSMAAGHFGSGWTWLVLGYDGRLEIATTHDADTPIAAGRLPLLACDVWEHAYYVDYRDDRKAYLEAWWDLVDWRSVASRLKSAEVSTPAAGR